MCGYIPFLSQPELYHVTYGLLEMPCIVNLTKHMLFGKVLDLSLLFVCLCSEGSGAFSGSQIYHMVFYIHTNLQKEVEALMKH